LIGYKEKTRDDTSVEPNAGEIETTWMAVISLAIYGSGSDTTLSTGLTLPLYQNLIAQFELYRLLPSQSLGDQTPAQFPVDRLEVGFL
jgi:hypothetical protein